MLCVVLKRVIFVWGEHHNVPSYNGRHDTIYGLNTYGSYMILNIYKVYIVLDP